MMKNVGAIGLRPTALAQSNERFNKTDRTEILEAYVFDTLDELRDITEQWRTTYDTTCPHDSLGGIPPGTYRKQYVRNTLDF